VVTAFVAIAKFALVRPAATVMLAGVVATATLPDTIVTTAPPVGAAAVNVTVPVDAFPPVVDAGFRVMDESAGTAGLTVKDAVLLTPL
jgi:hypothetical protein